MNRLIASMILVLVFTCCKKQNDNKSCSGLEMALSKNDELIMKKQLSAISRSVGKIPDNADFNQINAKLQQFVNAINIQCNLSAELICTLCIETLPAQSEVKLTSLSNNVYSVVDLHTEPGKFIEPLGFHE